MAKARKKAKGRAKPGLAKAMRGDLARIMTKREKKGPRGGKDTTHDMQG